MESAKEVAQEAQGVAATGHAITQEQFRAQLEKVDKTLRALPATAQVWADVMHDGKIGIARAGACQLSGVHGMPCWRQPAPACVPFRGTSPCPSGSSAAGFAAAAAPLR